MKTKLVFGFSAIALLLVLGVVFFTNVHLGSHHVTPIGNGVIDAWAFDTGVDFFTTITNRSDGAINWERGFDCAHYSQHWESAIGYQMSTYKARFEIRFAWMIKNTVYYIINDQIYAYPCDCLGFGGGDNHFLLFPAAK